MKKIFSLILALCLSVVITAQTRQSILVVADNTTAFGITQRVGSIIYDQLTNTLFEITAVAGVGDNLTTASTEVIAGGGGNLQAAYNLSVGGATPEIVTDATRLALTLRDNATPVGNVFDVQSNAGVSSFSVDPSLTAPATGTFGIITGDVATHHGLDINAEQTVSAPAGQLRGLNTGITHSGAGTQLVTYGNSSRVDNNSGTVSFGIAIEKKRGRTLSNFV